MYVKLNGKIVSELILDVDPAFPDVPIGERYPTDNSAKVEVGMEYDAETDSFGYPEATSAPDADEEVVENTDGITQAEINLDVEYRLACLELGI